MLLDSIVRVGRPIASSTLSNKERIKYLTDIDSESCKNFFKNIFIVEVSGEKIGFQYLQLYSFLDENNNAVVDYNRAPSFPFFMPSGGNPLHAQGAYPTMCYLAYDRHIKEFLDPEKTKKMILDRLKRTISLKDWKVKEKEELAKKASQILAAEISPYIEEKDKQLGILTIIDYRLNLYELIDKETFNEKESWLYINKSVLNPQKIIALDSDKVIDLVVESRFEEAKELGAVENATSTLSNEKKELAVSPYNKTWLWLSPTWEMPRSIYWKQNEWTKGIRLSRDEYEGYVYGSQFLKSIQTQLSSSLLKEMFAPVMNAEAKQHMNVTSFEPIYGIPLVLPLVEGDSNQMYKKYKRLLVRDEENKTASGDIHLEFIAGLRRVIPKTSDDYRLTLLYYSGNLSRGDIHIRAVIEDVIPSVADNLQQIFRELNKKGELSRISRALNFPEDRVQKLRINFLPSLLANAFGPGYVWSSMRQVFHRRPLGLGRLKRNITSKLNELANKGNKWQMKQELIFYYAFLFFYRRYEEMIRGTNKGVIDVRKWQEILERYQQGKLMEEDFDSVEKVGFISGLASKQFSHSYYNKTGKDFIEHRVMKFGAKLTPEMIWKQGLKETEELAMQWDLGVAKNFYEAISWLLLRFLDLDKEGLLKKEKDNFMTAFWSGYLMYQK